MNAHARKYVISDGDNNNNNNNNNNNIHTAKYVKNHHNSITGLWPSGLKRQPYSSGSRVQIPPIFFSIFI